MFKIVPFELEHLSPMINQKGNEFISGWITDGHAEVMTKIGFTCLVNDVPMLIGGVQKYWEGRGHVWAIFNLDSKYCFLPVFRSIRMFLKEQNYRRLELYVPVHLGQQRRRARLLGFESEGFARKFTSEGEDVELFSMVRV